MKRRNFLKKLGFGAVATPIAVQAEVDFGKIFEPMQNDIKEIKGMLTCHSTAVVTTDIAPQECVITSVVVDDVV